MLAGASTSCLYPMYTEDSLKYLTDNGVKNIEIFFNSSSEIKKDFVDGLKNQLDKTGARVISVHPYTCGIEPFMFFTNYERRFDDILNYYRKYFEVAELLGAKYFVFHGNKEQNPFPEEDYFRRYEKLYDTAQDYGITVVQENVARCISGSLEVEKRMIEALGDKARFTLDTKQAIRRGYNPYDFVEALGKHISHIHISDYDDKCDCILVGKGKLDFVRFINKMKSLSYTGGIMLELYSFSYNNIAEVIGNVKYMNKIIEESCNS